MRSALVLLFCTALVAVPSGASAGGFRGRPRARVFVAAPQRRFVVAAPPVRPVVVVRPRRPILGAIRGAIGGFRRGR